MKLFLVFVFLTLTACTSLVPEYNLKSHVAIDERRESAAGHFIGAQTGAECVGLIPFSASLRLDMLGFYAKYSASRNFEVAPVFIPPAKTIRVLVYDEQSRSVTASIGYTDDFLKNVIFDVPKGWCSRTLHALLVSNDGGSIQLSDKMLMGPLAQVSSGASIEVLDDLPAFPIKDVAEGGVKAHSFFSSHSSRIPLYPGNLDAYKESLVDTEALSLQAVAPETREEEWEDKAFSNGGFTLGSSDILYPPGLGMKGLYAAIDAGRNSYRRPHGFTWYRCFSSSEIERNIEHVWRETEQARQGMAQACGKETHDIDRGRIEKLIPGSSECIHPKTVALLIEGELRQALLATQSGGGCQTRR
mgnify:CR=1 FL=1